MNKKRSQQMMILTRVIGGIMLLILVILICYVFFRGNVNLYQARQSGGFTIMKGFTNKEVSDSQAPLGVHNEYTQILDKKMVSKDCIAFYVVHQYVKVYIGHELVYNLCAPKNSKLGKTTGSNWVMIPLELSDEGKEFIVQITPVYESSQNQNVEFLIGDNLAIYVARLKADLPQMLMSALSILLGILFVSVSLYNFFKKKYDTMLFPLGIFAILLGVWKIFDTRFTPFLLNQNPRFVSLIVLTTLMLLALPLAVTIKNQFQDRKYKVMDVVCCILVIVDFCVVLLQVFGIKDFRETLVISHISIFFAAFVSTAVIIYDKMKRKSNWTATMKSNLFLLCIVGSLADVFAFYIKGNSSGIIFTLATFLLYMIITGITIISGYMDQEKKMRLQEHEMANNRISIMLSQIQPHFLYNTLNTIYHLCGKDVDAAKKAISDFSDYLRTNLDSIKKTIPVSFETELRHLQIYLSLEKMRFEEELNVVYDIQCTDFLIPALSVQPLVENAVKYGVGKKTGGGTVKIIAKECDEYYEVTVADDGVGYNLNQKQYDGRTHIGIDNVEKRLWEMSRATLEISSIVDIGTTAIIRIPKDEYK